MPDPMRAETDVLVIGSGAAGMYAAIEAAREGASVLLAERSLIDGDHKQVTRILRICNTISRTRVNQRSKGQQESQTVM